MKSNTITRLLGLGGALLLLVAVPQARALTISQFLAAAGNENMVGFVRDGVPFGEDDRITYMNHLLGLGANVDANVFDGQKYYTGPTDFNGTVTKPDSQLGTGVATVSGWDFLFVKYDGPNAGVIVYALNGASFNIAANIDDLGSIQDGVDDKGKPNILKGGVSGWSLYGTHSVPDGGSTIALLGCALVGVDFLRRKIVKS